LNKHWKIWIDTGGTFTDCLAISPNEEIKRLKVLSSSLLRLTIARQTTLSSFIVHLPIAIKKDFLNGFTFVTQNKASKIIEVDIERSEIFVDIKYHGVTSAFAEITTCEEVPVFAARLLTETGVSESFPPLDLRLGSTRGTNALLERKGARTAFLVTKGFKDLLLIGNQQRPDLFALNIIKEPPLYHAVEEVDERIYADGTVKKELTLVEAERISYALKKKKIDSVAVALMNSYRNPAHEILLKSELERRGYSFISTSHALSNQIKILQRAETTVVNAYLDPIIQQYVGRIKKELCADRFFIMSSAGGLLSANDFKPKDSLLSGPAGGVIGSLSKATQAGRSKIITFDMGGTSTDVSLCNGRPDYRFESVIGKLRIFSPSLAIETIAAGGGSICSQNGYRLQVGPHSAGSKPGPACYGAGGPLTITDVNLLLGRLDADNFSIPILLESAQERLDEIMVGINKGRRKNSGREEILEAFIDIANEKMAEAINKVSLQKGYDPREYALLCFGGAGGQHACSLSSMLGVSEIVFPYDAGLLSAYGIGQAKIERIVEKLFLKPLNEVLYQLNEDITHLYEGVKLELLNEGFQGEAIHIEHRFLFLRLYGQETSIEMQYEEGDDIGKSFSEQYRHIYGHWIDNRIIELEMIRVVVTVNEVRKRQGSGHPNLYKPKPEKLKLIFCEKKWRNSPVYRWEKLQPGATIDGPALVLSDNSTLFVEANWNLTLGNDENAVLKRQKVKKRKASTSEQAMLELYTNRFTAVAQDMGALLQRTSFSVNVKERLDFSCALLDSKGNLIVNAPHIPVHLGSLGVCVRTVQKAIALNEGDVVITNHPAFGGSHLPDITLIRPVYFQKKLIGFVANRAHHAEIGGKKPGSMPADAKTLAEEGVVIPPTLLMKGKEVDWANIEKTFCSSLYPSRNVQENLADLNGALASLLHGEKEMQRLCRENGMRELISFMEKIYQHSSILMRKKIRTLSSKTYKAVERLDDGTRLVVEIRKKKDMLMIDFTGTSPVHSGNMNATEAIVNSVVLYVLRLLINEPVPLNEGLLEPVKLIIPRGLLNPTFSSDSFKSPAVVGGNTEVSQRLTDTLLKAFQLAACSQGTMNNFLFGNAEFGYYETICGGTGAGVGFNGSDAVHQHMTNTRITDPEIMEHRYPVILERFGVRRGSGGKGRWSGGNGVLREVIFNQTVEMNILSQHRREQPYGIKGGAPGKKGSQMIVRSDGKKERLKGVDGRTVCAGDRVIIKTPGGGGCGKQTQ
jgi:5-oxoprolinase (ATP-hydrolysing)